MASPQNLLCHSFDILSDFEYYQQSYQCYDRKSNRSKVVKEWMENEFDSNAVHKLTDIGQTLNVLGVGSGDGE